MDTENILEKAKVREQKMQSSALDDHEPNSAMSRRTDQPPLVIQSTNNVHKMLCETPDRTVQTSNIELESKF